jgi:hypothetical protein
MIDYQFDCKDVNRTQITISMNHGLLLVDSLGWPEPSKMPKVANEDLYLLV